MDIKELFEKYNSVCDENDLAGFKAREYKTPEDFSKMDIEKEFDVKPENGRYGVIYINPEVAIIPYIEAGEVKMVKVMTKIRTFENEHDVNTYSILIQRVIAMTMAAVSGVDSEARSFILNTLHLYEPRYGNNTYIFRGFKYSLKIEPGLLLFGIREV